MAEESEDIREVPWHPRFSMCVLGHETAHAQFTKAFESGRPHHAWLIDGPRGIGKATLAYAFAKLVLGKSEQTKRWIESRAHPDLFVMERQLNDAKPRKLKSEISVEDARSLAHFFARTASGGWRVAIIDAADDLNSESANAILKLVEEPPPRSIVFLLAHQPGRLLRTLKSRCLRLTLDPLVDHEILSIIRDLGIEEKVESKEISRAVAQSNGCPGQALSLLTSIGAKAFADFVRLGRPKTSDLISIANKFAGRGAGPDEFNLFTSLLLDWLASQAKTRGTARLAEVHAAISEDARITQGFNLDRKQAVMVQLQLVNDALKAY